MSGSQLTPDERAKRLEAMLDDIRDEPDSIPAPEDAPASAGERNAVEGGAAANGVTADVSSPDLESLDAGWGEDEEAEQAPDAPLASDLPPAAPNADAAPREEKLAAKAAPVPEAPPPAPPTPVVPVSAAPPAHHFDDDEDERTVIGTVPDLVARTRHQMLEPSIETQRPTPVKNVIVEPAAQLSEHMKAARQVAPATQSPPKVAIVEPRPVPQVETKAPAPASAPTPAAKKLPTPKPAEIKPIEKPISVVDKKAAEERALARKDQKRAKVEEARERKRAKAEAAAAKQKQKQPKARRSTSEPLVKIARPDTQTPDDSGDIPATEAPDDSTRTVRTNLNKNRDLVRMAMIVAIVVLLGGTALVMLRR